MVGPHNGSTREFAGRLRQRREELNWTRQILADRMQVTVATVGNWERGIGFPEISSRERLCALLGKSAKELRLPPYNEVV
jgi:transcriptional regulator with XRE-family HTH domain